MPPFLLNRFRSESREILRRRLRAIPSLEKHRGVTLVEVLVAAAVGSIGLLGMAALLSISAKANHAAYEITQVGFAADALVDAMHVNSAAVASGSYEGTFDLAT